MALKQVNLAVNDYCNNRCTTCDIYLNPKIDKTRADEYIALLRHKSFRDVLEVSITGGEPLMRRDLNVIMDAVASELPKLQWVFLNTNGTYPDRVVEFIKNYAPKLPKLTISVSLEGMRDVHNAIRGVKSFDSVVKTLKLAAKSGYQNVSAVISTTVSSLNANGEQLGFIKGMAEEIGCTYTFRLAGESVTYYRKGEGTIAKLTPEDKRRVVEFIEKNCAADVFQQFQKRYIETGATGLACTAGSDFAFVQADGNIYPCIFSTRIIGNKAGGITIQEPIKDLGKFEPCPCCTECAIYPMINYGPNAHVVSGLKSK